MQVSIIDRATRNLQRLRESKRNWIVCSWSDLKIIGRYHAALLVSPSERASSGHRHVQYFCAEIFGILCTRSRRWNVQIIVCGCDSRGTMDSTRTALRFHMVPLPCRDEWHPYHVGLEQRCCVHGDVIRLSVERRAVGLMCHPQPPPHSGRLLRVSCRDPRV